MPCEGQDQILCPVKDKKKFGPNLMPCEGQDQISRPVMGRSWETFVRRMIVDTCTDGRAIGRSYRVLRILATN